MGYDTVEILMPGILQNPMNYKTEEVLATGFMALAVSTPAARSNLMTLPLVAVGSYQAVYQIVRAGKALLP